jgi:multiple sugar transport system permease protein
MTRGAAGSHRRSLGTGLLWIAPWLIGVALFTAWPIVESLRFSLTDASMLDEPVYIGLDNYKEMLGDSLFKQALVNTIVFACANAGGTLILSLALALLLELGLRGSSLARVIIFAPTVVPIVAACVTWEHMLQSGGLLNSIIAAAGFTGPNWLSDSSWAMPSIILMSVWVIGTPFLTLSAAVRSVPPSLYDACSIDGAGVVRRFRHVTLPMISPALLFSTFMSVIWSLQVIGPPLIMTEGGPEGSTITHSMYVYKSAFEFGRMGYASALAWVQVMLTAAVVAMLAFTFRGRSVSRGS